MKSLTASLINGETFPSEAFDEYLPGIESIERDNSCLADTQRAAAIYRLRLFETALTNAERLNIDQQLDALNDDVRNSLSCSPTDAYLWLVLFRVQYLRDGFGPEIMSALKMSYLVGPREGWVAIKRNRFAFELFNQLPQDLQEKAIDELIGMINSGIYSEAKDIFIGPAWPFRDAILAHFCSIRLENRTLFARMLKDDGIDIEIPCVGHTARRPAAGLSIP